MALLTRCSLLAALLGAGCVFAPDLGNGKINCGDDGTCPDRYVCAADRRCYRDTTPPDLRAFAGDAGAPVDLNADQALVDATAAVIDATAVIDQRINDLRTIDQTTIDLRTIDQAMPDLRTIDQAMPDLRTIDQAMPDLRTVDQAMPDLRLDLRVIDQARVD